MFGKTQLPHDERYHYADDWMQLIKALWSNRGEFDFTRQHQVHGIVRFALTEEQSACRKCLQVADAHQLIQELRQRNNNNKVSLITGYQEVNL